MHLIACGLQDCSKCIHKNVNKMALLFSYSSAWNYEVLVDICEIKYKVKYG